MSLQKYQNITSLKKAREQGFTIVELLIVIIVIAILAALVITAYTGVQDQARNSARKAAATSVKTAVAAYSSDSTNTTGKSWPTTIAEITGQNTVKLDSTVISSISGGGAPSSATNNITLQNCGSGAGVKIHYWSGSAQVYDLGTTSGSCVSMT